MTALALAGWALASCGAWRALVLHRRLELVASAEHELRGPLAALTLAAGRASAVDAEVLRGQLERAGVALADLSAARLGRRAPAEPRQNDPLDVVERAAAGWRAAGGDVELDWRAGASPVNVDQARLSQALGNLLSNAIEHGGGQVELRGVRAGGRVRIELTDSGPGFAHTPGPDRAAGRGRGLAIAARAVEEAGGTLRIASGDGGSTVAVELPLADGA